MTIERTKSNCNGTHSWLKLANVGFKPFKYTFLLVKKLVTYYALQLDLIFSIWSEPWPQTG